MDYKGEGTFQLYPFHVRTIAMVLVFLNEGMELSRYLTPKGK